MLKTFHNFHSLSKRIFVASAVALFATMFTFNVASAEPRPIHGPDYIIEKASNGPLDNAQRTGKHYSLPPIPQEILEPSPYAPEGLTGCDEMNWYMEAVGLPDIFNKIGWGESNCRNEEAVRTWCCHGYFQMYTSLHMQDHRLAPMMRECGVESHHDLNSNTPKEKLAQACAAKALYDLNGTDPWVATR